MGETNDNRNDRDNGNFGCGIMGLGRMARRAVKSVRYVVIESETDQTAVSKIKRGNKNMNTVKHAIAKSYINVRNILNDESGTTAFETMIITVMLAVVCVIVATALAGFVDNSDAASGLLGGALGID